MPILENWDGQLWIVLDVAIASLLGGAIGVERQLAGKPAGIRTLMLVAGAAAFLMSLGTVMVHVYSGKAGDQVSADPVRMMQAIIVGISFLGAGTIITHRGAERVEGLTTAAAILMVAAIGASIALGQYVLGFGVTLLALIILRALRALERSKRRRTRQEPSQSSDLQ
jgi:putative Mg2+ transporter-C (MgtC) family protein